MSAQPWMKFYPRDWRGDQALRAVSVAARGFWMECLCIMHEAKPYGHLLLNGEKVEDGTLARMTGTSAEEAAALIAELTKAGVLSVTNKGVVFSRRMTKDHSRATKGRKAVEKRYSQDTENKEEKKPPTRLIESDLLLRSQKPDTRKTDSSLPLGNPVDEDFDRWYRLYPKKVARPQALKAYAKARRKVSERDLLDGLERYKRTKPDYADWAHPATWLNGERWADEVPTTAPTSSPGSKGPATQSTEYQARDPADFDLNDWIVRVRLFREKGSWADTWGAKPQAEGALTEVAQTYLERHRRAA